MAKYKITCNNLKWVESQRDELDFKAVAYTDSEDVANKYKSNTLHTGGKPMFEVEEIKESK